MLYVDWNRHWVIIYPHRVFAQHLEPNQRLCESRWRIFLYSLAADSAQWIHLRLRQAVASATGRIYRQQNTVTKLFNILVNLILVSVIKAYIFLYRRLNLFLSICLYVLGLGINFHVYFLTARDANEWIKVYFKGNYPLVGIGFFKMMILMSGILVSVSEGILFWYFHLRHMTSALVLASTVTLNVSFFTWSATSNAFGNLYYIIITSYKDAYHLN